MRNSDKAEFAKRLYEMFKAYRKADEFDDDTLVIWWNRLHQDFGIGDFKVAAAELEKVSKFLFSVESQELCTFMRWLRLMEFQ